MNLPQAESGPDSNINSPYYTVGWVEIGTRKKVPLRFVTYMLQK
jgi:hypothetical protein